MNLFFALLWLAAAIGLFAYDFATGQVRFTIRGLNISAGWLLLLLAGWNFVRWYSVRAQRAELEALRTAHEARQRHSRVREMPAEPDPTFDFSDRPPEPPAGAGRPGG